MILGLNNFGSFKKKISRVKMILNEPSFIFRDDGLYIKEIDISNENLVYIHFGKEYFNDYNFTENVTYKVNLFNFYNCLKTLSVKYKLYLEFSDNTLKLSSIGQEKTQSYYMDILKYNKIINSLKEENNILYNNIFEINYCRKNKIDNMGDFNFKDVSIEIKDKNIFLESRNEDITVSKKILGVNFIKSTNYNIKSIYKLKNIKKIFSFLVFDSKNIISINNNSPIKIEVIGEHFNIVLISSNSASI